MWYKMAVNVSAHPVLIIFLGSVKAVHLDLSMTAPDASNHRLYVHKSGQWWVPMVLDVCVGKDWPTIQVSADKPAHLMLNSTQPPQTVNATPTTWTYPTSAFHAEKINLTVWYKEPAFAKKSTKSLISMDTVSVSRDFRIYRIFVSNVQVELYLLMVTVNLLAARPTRSYQMEYVSVMIFP